jgi:alpha-1,6-mannosyltransferase
LLLAGTVGSVLLALGSTGAGALPAAGLDLLRGSSALALALCVVGVLLLSAVWWASRGGSARHQLTAAGLWSLPLLLAAPLASRDAFAYVGQGALVAEGLDPYAVGPGALASSPTAGPLVEGVDAVWLDAPAPYGPLWLLLSGLVVRLTGSVVPALVGMRLLAVLGLVLVAWALPRIAARHGVPAGRALWLGLANPLVLVHLVGGAHNEALMIGLMVAGVAVAGPGWRRPALAAALVTGAVLVKVPAVAALAYLPLVVPGWPARLRAAGVVGVSAVATALVVTLASGLGWGWLTVALGAGRARLSLFSPLTGLGVLLPGGDATLDVVLTSGLLLALVLAAVLLLRADRLGPVRALGLTLLGVSLLLPVVQPWYVLWGVVLLAAVSSARVAAALGVTCLVLVLLIAPSGRNVIRPPLYGVPTLLAVAAGAVALRRASPSSPDHARRTPEHTSLHPGGGPAADPR